MTHRPATQSSRGLSIASALLVGTALTPAAAFAQDATWNGATAVYNTNGNWTPGTVPTNRATLAGTGQTTVAVTANASINEILFAAGAQQYVFVNDATFAVNGIGSAGITNASNFLQTITNNRSLTFNNNATVNGGTANILIQNFSNAGSNASIIFNGNSVLGSTTQLLSLAASASGVGNSSLGAGVSATFNNNSSADGAVLTFGGGAGGGQGGVAVGGTGTGGDHNAAFNDASHADDRTIANVGGGGIGQGGGDILSTGTGNGGNATLVFTGTSHADDSAIANTGGAGTAVGGPAGAGDGTGGAAIVTFGNDSHADGTTITNTGGGAISSSGTGAAGMPGGTGATGGEATAEGGTAILVFSGNAHINNGAIVNATGSASASAGVGGMGDTGAGGSGGSSTSTAGSASVQLVGNSQASGTDIANGTGTSAALAGTGGAGGSTGAGGTGGSATASSSLGATVQIAGNTSIVNATISNRGTDGLAAGGTGGAGGSGAAGGTGGAATATGNAAVIIFSGGVTIGAGVTINNRGGDATAAGGTGGAGGSGAAGTGGTGGAAEAEGGLAFVSFNDNISVGNATIINTAGTAAISNGDGGAGNAGNGGNGGEAVAEAGDASISFNDTSSAGTATITNNAGATPTVTTGTAGAGGNGGAAAGGSLTAGEARITFNDNSTGGGAHIENVGGRVTFNDASIFGTAAGASIINRGVGFVVFNNSASLGSGAITSGGTATGAVSFFNTATAGTGTLANLSGGSTFFRDSSSAGAATINNNPGGQVAFSDTSSGGNATINNSGAVFFGGDSDAVAARVIQTGGTTSIAGANLTTRLGSLSGTGGTVTLGANILQTGYLNLNDTFAGVISGTGGLVKRGTGTMVLTGANIYTGSTTVAAGTLQIDGSVTSNTATSVGGTLRGIGTITGNLINNGTVNAGNAASPTGTLRVTGSFTSNAGSFFLVNIAGTANNLLNATGALTLTGGTVRPQATPGTFFPMQFDYRIAAGASRTGGFTGIDESLLPGFVDASLFYTATEAFLRIRRNATNFAATAGLTPNQQAVSTSLDAAVVAANPLVFTTYLGTYNALLTAPDATLRASLDTLSGDALTVTPIAAQGAVERFGDRLTAHTWSNSSNIWGLVAYGDQDGDGDGNGPGFEANGLAVQIGFATSIGTDTRFGLSAAMTNDDVDVVGRVASAEVDTWSVGAHIRHDFSMVYVAAQLTYNWHSIDTSRALLGGGAATARFDGSTWTGSAELGGRFPVGPHFAVEPYLSLRHASTDQEGYTETGAAGALNVASAGYETTRAGIGLRLVNRDPASAVRPYALVSYEREMGDETAALDNDLIGLPTFRVVSTELGQDVFTARAGIEADVGGGVSLFGDAGGRWRSNEKTVHAEAGLRIRF